MEERIQSILSHAGVTSRRHAAELIEAGRVSVDGKVWTARTENDDIKVPEGSRAVVVRIEGVKLFVKPCEKNEEVRK